jgi:hypothetical protein
VGDYKRNRKATPQWRARPISHSFVPTALDVCESGINHKRKVRTKASVESNGSSGRATLLSHHGLYRSNANQQLLGSIYKTIIYVELILTSKNGLGNAGIGPVTQPP